ncbi:hypothetical protein CONPUDRAFT_74634 [Coniophora puteana RWD-64-598 SS2]|uniref:Uncharacterized protein n=1 Tax=Coniophora puteana (strain RWD-64-598) TaxID=741705 RepID=A0A5M3MIS9_CONPW|nr:uncharacterized protein CONPUDRAFT_74634 [Coniophora puteana RWD-64-598 SS2]EIW79122.1 hypothetical protein CONPUDRAFT_74634 [Coniophora puteana RWD-64-598 SS2]
MVKHITRVIIHGHGLLNSTRHTEPVEWLEEFFDNLTWPHEYVSHDVHLTVDLTTGKKLHSKGSIKADQWKNLISVLFVGLFAAWEHNGIISDTDAPPSGVHTTIAKTQAKYTAATQARLRKHAITQDLHTAPEVLDQLSNAWASMHLPLTPYFPFGQHCEEQLYKCSPTYGHWTFLHNHHKGGELEVMLMQQWWAVFNYKLLLQLEALPDKTSDNEDSIKLLQESLKEQSKLYGA